MKRLGLTLIVLALLVGAVAWWSTPAPLDPGVTTQLASNEGLPSVAAPHRSSLSTEPGSPSPLEAEVSESHNQGDADPTDSLELQARARAKADDLIAKFEAETVYPSWSRPADGSNRHVVEWNQPESIGQPFAEDAEGREIRADLQLSRMFVGPGETQVAKVSASVVEDGAPAALDEVKISLDWFDGNGWQSALELPVVRDGDGWRAEVVPAAVPALRARPVDVRIRAYVRAGEMDRELAIGFRYNRRGVAEGSGPGWRSTGPGGLAPAPRGGGRGHRADLVAGDPLRRRRSTRPGGLRGLSSPQPSGSADLAPADLRPDPQRSRPRRELPTRANSRLRLPPRTRAREQFFARAEDPPLVTGSYRAANFRSEAYDSPEKREQLARYRGLQPASR
jgi:hypothetical protein